jgi:hypothetical protein
MGYKNDPSNPLHQKLLYSKIAVVLEKLKLFHGYGWIKRHQTRSDQITVLVKNNNIQCNLVIFNSMGPRKNFKISQNLRYWGKILHR